MKKTILRVFISTLLTMIFSSQVFAHGRWHHYDSGSWVGPAIVGGLITYSLMTPRVYAQPTIVYSPPQPQLMAQTNPPVWYYCPSSQMYYPYTNACPDGWQAVPARPAY
jgi:hypothetical protein